MANNNKYSRYYTYIKPAVENKYVRSSAPYVFSLLTITILTLFAIRPTVSTILNLQKQLEENQKVLASLEEKADNLSKAKRNYKNLNPSAKQKVKTSIPDQPSVISLISSLQSTSGNTASASALQIQPTLLIDNTLSTGKARLNLGEVSFSYNVQGSFSQLLTILQNINRTPRLIDIDTLVVNKQTEEKTTVMSVTGKVYYLK